MHDHLPLLDKRAQRVLRERIIPASATTLAVAKVSAVELRNGDGSVSEPLPWRLDADYSDVTLPHRWGPAWATTWFRLEVEVLEHAPGELELHVDLGWQDHSAGFQCEALVRDGSGKVLKGLHPRNSWIPIGDDVGTQVFYLEAAANPLLLQVPPFVPVDDGDRATASDEPGYEFRRADLVRIHRPVAELAADLEVLTAVAATLAEDSLRRWRISYAIQDALDALDTENVVATAQNARDILASAQLPADADAMQVSAVGHAHIDSAWLWPLRETRRKVARTLANVCHLLDAGQDFWFALPAAQHVAWLAEDQPEIFDRVCHWVAEGRIVPVGGMWVEPDAVLPGGEAMVRQFLYGQRYFAQTFGSRCTGMWLPDSFGYSGALPQIARLAGANWFLTQKISWNQVNTFPHHSFWWEGIDGTRLFTHFPAVDTYNSDLSPAELDHAVRGFKEKGRANRTLAPFGYGDGGGGPTREMIARGKRMANLAGAPKVEFGPPDEFFTAAAAELGDPDVWVGELYLELHRGTFTTQCETKRGNRRNEHLLREAELWCTMATVSGLADYPYDELDDCWRTVLLGQFHDILPGTSIAWVHKEIVAGHDEVSDRLRTLTNQAQKLLAGEGDQQLSFNAAPFARDGVAPLAAQPISAIPEGQAQEVDGGYELSSDTLQVRFDDAGRLVGLLDRRAGRELLPPGVVGGVLHLIPDFPNEWDAWDIDRFQRTDPLVLDQFDACAEGDTVVTHLAFADSTASLRYRIIDDAVDIEVEVDWHEHDQLLKLVLPVDVHTHEARFETQFGHIRRAIHENTSWDAQRFEVSLHRWVHLSEADYGVALANDASHGMDLLRAARQGGGSYVVLRPSLIRGPRFPDPHADQGRHQFRFTLVPGANVTDAARHGYQRNLTPAVVSGSPVAPMVSADGALIEALKLAADRSGDVIVRLYEPTGARRQVGLTLDPGWQVQPCNLLEEPFDDVVATQSEPGRWSLACGPFQIISLRLVRR